MDKRKSDISGPSLPSLFPLLHPRHFAEHADFLDPSSLLNFLVGANLVKFHDLSQSSMTFGQFFMFHDYFHFSVFLETLSLHINYNSRSRVVLEIKDVAAPGLQNIYARGTLNLKKNNLKNCSLFNDKQQKLHPPPMQQTAMLLGYSLLLNHLFI